MALLDVAEKRVQSLTDSPLAPPASGSGTPAGAQTMTATNVPTTTDPTTGVPQAQAYTQDFDESKGVAGRVADITSSGSALMKIAETRGLQGAAQRGLSNSTLGVEAAQKAVIEQATPIAQADAGLYQQQALTNQNAKNQVGVANAGLAQPAVLQQRELALKRQELDQQEAQFARTLGLSRDQLALSRDSLTQNQQQFLASLEQQRAQLAQQESQFGRSLDANQQNFNAELAMKETLAVLDANLREKLVRIDAESKEAQQSSVNLTNAWQQMLVNVGNIQNNPELNDAAKTTLINNNLEAFAAFSSFVGKTSSVPVDDLLNFRVTTPAGGSTTNTSGLIGAAAQLPIEGVIGIPGQYDWSWAGGG